MNVSDKNKILNPIVEYYAEKLKMYGATHRGVDWSSTDSQFMRFQQLLRLVDSGDDMFSLLDFGCGYGGMYGYASRFYGERICYAGFDILPETIVKAEELYGNNEKVKWFNNIKQLPCSDYVISSGVFNVKLKASNTKWMSYVLDTLIEMNRLSKKGFAFNLLSTYSDKPMRKPYLYYASPVFYFDYCKKNFSDKVALLHDYPLYEFTIIVKKQ